MKIWPDYSDESPHAELEPQAAKADITCNEPQVDDFSAEALLDPIKLLDEMARLEVYAPNESSIGLVNWDGNIDGMISQAELVKRISVQKKTIDRYVREHRIIPDKIVPLNGQSTQNFYTEETVRNICSAFGWEIVEEAQLKQRLFDELQQMAMAYSYKPVLLKALFSKADDYGRMAMSDVIEFFIAFYENRRQDGLFIEQPDSVFVKEHYSLEDARRTIRFHPVERFAEMNFIRYVNASDIIEVNESLWDTINQSEKQCIIQKCDEKISQYYSRCSGTGE